ncbi:hypothetical protein [Methylobacterium sp. ARG-1]|uniref:hypothetical protein n=1 Tax=Methylobacterium sp. ARG-1 TaxID=1692501 RepID=UPI0011875968|nr:hypothetical protein [Methylobacterium sp. ARG-1]
MTKTWSKIGYRVCMSSIAAICAQFWLTDTVYAMDRRIKSLQAYSITLGLTRGIAYFTDQRDGFLLVVTTAAEGGAATRFETLLGTPEQSVTLSAPRAAGQPAMHVTFTRSADGLRVSNDEPDVESALSLSEPEGAATSGNYLAAHNNH